jgi:hypothetical protein
VITDGDGDGNRRQRTALPALVQGQADAFAGNELAEAVATGVKKSGLSRGRLSFPALAAAAVYLAVTTTGTAALAVSPAESVATTDNV